MRTGVCVLALFLSACASPAATPIPAELPVEPPDISFAGLVTDVRIFEEHYEFTDADGSVHAIEIGEHREISGHGCCGELLVLGTDVHGAFMASFRTQDGLPDDCYVERAPGIDRGSHVEINGVLWRKASGFADTVSFGTPYPPAARFCFDERGRVTSVVTH